MALIQTRSPLYPVAIIAGCAVGFVVGGFAAPLFGGHPGFESFNAVYGLTLGGLVAAGLLEFGAPLIAAFAALAGLAGGGGSSGAANGAWLDPGRLNIAGHLLRTTIVLAGIAACGAALWFGTRPAAAWLDAPAAVAVAVLLLIALPGLVLLSIAASALARYLDLTVE